MKVDISDWESDGSRTVNIDVHPWDTWDAVSSLAYVNRAVLTQFRDERLKKDQGGIPQEFFREGQYDPSDEECDQARAAWHAAVDEMIWAFNEIIEETEHDACFTKRGEWKLSDPDPETGLVELLDSGFDLDEKRLRECRDRVQNGLFLYATHFRSLWA